LQFSAVMNSELLLVVGLLVLCIGLFVINKPRMDVVALLAIVVLPLCGLVTVPEALTGFSDPNIILIAALFVIGEGLVRTGIASKLGEWLVSKAGGDENRLLLLLMLAVAGLGAVMSSTGVVAIFIPVVLGVSKRMSLPAGRLMMPLSFAGLISGMLTLVATAPNLVIDSALRHAGFAGFGLFSPTPFGLAILVMGIAYMLVARHWLSVKTEKSSVEHSTRTLLDLIREYDLAGREHRLRIQPNSPLVGQALQEWDPRSRYGANVVAVERAARFRREVLIPHADTKLMADDVLLVDAPTSRIGEKSEFFSSLRLERLPLEGSYFTDQSQKVGMAEVLLVPNSGLIGRSVEHLAFRKYGLNLIGLRRSQQAVALELPENKIQSGDTLLLIGPWKEIRQLQAQTHDFVVLSLPAEINQVAPALSQAPYALLSLIVMIVLMVTGIVPNVIAALIGCLLMGLFRCVDMDSAYKSINWQILLLIVGMMPFASALQKTGGIELAVEGLLNLFGNSAVHVILAALFGLTALIGLFISNTVTAVLMGPIALSLAHHLKASPYPFAMIVALAASAAFMTPVSSPVNMLVLGPGQYRFTDFVKIGTPFTLLVMLISVLMVPWLLPLY
jgi:di/tricarboxylate transporter